ncbi:protein fantom-like [Gigantopelta aegis]|uniref:protein fantom-like n=1 Tax=Gigantopelta aegis TaxID=1735272 RepID=UPI001B88D56C|nr:protein fantom-like [Gigantopelta aegis]
MSNHDLIPVRDIGNKRVKNMASDIAILDHKAAQHRGMVSKWTRDELEDKYLRNYEENIILKKHARKQEDKIKRMATKLLRLVNDKKKSDGGYKKGFDIETESKISDLEARLIEYEKVNAQLKEKLMVTKQQLASALKRPMPAAFSQVQARIDTGIPHQHTLPVDTRLKRNMRVIGPAPPGRHRALHSPVMHPYGQGTLEDRQADRRQLERHIAELSERLNVYEMEIEELREQNRMRETEFEEDILKLKQQMTAEQNDVSSRRSSSKFYIIFALEENTRVLKHSHDQLLMEMESLNMQLKEEENKVLILRNDNQNNRTQQKKILEMQEQVRDLQRENAILKEANEKLVSSAFDLEREREWRQRENALKVQIAQLEATLKSDLGEKGSIIDRYAAERDSNEKTQQEFREMQINYYQVKEQYDDLEEKMKFFTKESAIDFTEIEEALVLVKQKKQHEQKHPEFLQRVDEEMEKDVKKSLLELQAEYAETVHELEKTRNMLIVQHKINKDYQIEVDLAASKMDDLKKEYEMKLDEYARLLDIRAARIKKLEAQLRDVAYGTRQFKILPPTEDEECTIEFDETIHLEKGQNLFEIHITKVSLSDEGIRQLGDDEPSIFCTWEFFEFEIQSTPVLRGARLEYDFTSQYVVKVDDFFLHFLQKDACTLEVHQSFGQDYVTIAACQLVFKDIFDKPHGRIHGVVSLTGVGHGGEGVGYGAVEYWVRLRVPMEQALRLYKERTKALGYITCNEKIASQALEVLDDMPATRPRDNINKLDIKIISCSKLKARRSNIQPSPYCVYQFFDFNDHDTVILPSSNNPEFHDHKTYPVPMTAELDQYLKTVHLKIFVFDDTDPDETQYLGQANIPLISLVHNEPIYGNFELKRADNSKNGSINIDMRWLYPYTPPKIVKSAPLVPYEAAPDDPPQKLVATGSPTRPRLAARFQDARVPIATSTPVAKSRKAAIEEQVIEPDLSQVVAHPAARRRMEVPAQNETMVQDAVAAAVSDVMPGMSSEMSSLSDQAAVPGVAPDTIVEESEGEELKPRKSHDPDRQVVIESGSESGSLKVRPRPKTRTKKWDAVSEPKSVSKQEKQMADTYFGDKPTEDDEESIGEEIQEETLQEKPEQQQQQQQQQVLKDKPISESESEPTQIESDSEGVMMRSLPLKRMNKGLNTLGNTVTIVISHLSLYAEAPVMQKEHIKQLFVEYKFLNLSPQETETPFSLPKPQPNQQITFGFSKTILVDMEKHYERRQCLASMLLPNDPERGRIRFTVVSEPPEDDQDTDCEDVGVAFVSVKDILEQGRDVKDEDVPIYDAEDENTVIGTLNLTVECLSAMQCVEREMEVEGTY